MPNKYRLRCRVLAFWPADLAGLCIRRAPSLSSSDSEDHRGSLEYFFTLCLDDGTGSLVAIVCGEHAVGGGAAASAICSTHSAHRGVLVHERAEKPATGAAAV